MLATLNVNSVAEAQREREDLLQQVKLADEDYHTELKAAYDGVRGEPLDPEEVCKARLEEVKYVRGMKLYEKVSKDECWKVTGKGPIATKWIGINKGDDTRPNYRSWNVAREIAYKKMDGIFTATPPLEVMKILLSTLATANKGYRLMVADAKRAYLHAKCKRPTYVQLPPEDVLPRGENMCGRLNFKMYGTRDAAANWSE